MSDTIRWNIQTNMTAFNYAYIHRKSDVSRKKIVQKNYKQTYVMYAHCLMDKIDLVAAIPLLAIKTLRITRSPPFAFT